MTADLTERFCLAAHRVPSGVRWCCNLPPGHAGLHDDGCADQWADPPSPQKVMDALRNAGFTRVGGREGAYARMWWPENASGGTVIVSLDPDAPEHDEEMTDLRHKLLDAAARGRAAQQALNTIGWTEDGR